MNLRNGMFKRGENVSSNMALPRAFNFFLSGLQGNRISRRFLSILRICWPGRLRWLAKCKTAFELARKTALEERASPTPRFPSSKPVAKQKAGDKRPHRGKNDQHHAICPSRYPEPRQTIVKRTLSSKIILRGAENFDYRKPQPPYVYRAQ